MSSVQMVVGNSDLEEGAEKKDERWKEELK